MSVQTGSFLGTALVRQTRKKRLRHGLVAGVVTPVLLWAGYGAEFSVLEVFRGLPSVLTLLRQLFPPDLRVLPKLGTAVVETIQTGFLSTLLAALLAFPLGFLGAKNMSLHPAVYGVARAALNVFRGVSELIWALLFVAAVGLGPFPGVLALVIFSTGAIGKLLAEAVEAVHPGPIEAMRAAGASEWKVFLYAVWPQVIPLFLTYTLYYWDHNTRQATILGFVGAGGIGYTLFMSISLYNYEEVTTCVLVMIAMIMAIDRICWALRRRLI